MLWFVVKRLVWMLLTLWGVFTLSFFLMRAVPGGPFDSEHQLEPAVRANIEARYHLNDPFWQQYRDELTRLLHGDLGPSYKLADFQVSEVIRQGFPVSATLGAVALVLAISVGLIAGIVASVWRGTGLDLLVMSIATIGIALPSFVLAGLLLIVFVFEWPLLPPAGWGSPSQLVLPAVCLAAPFAAYIARLVRTGMLDVLGQDYIRTARAKGLLPSAVIFRHALRAALLPVVSFLGPAIAGILTGSLVVEQIFYVPGLGVHFVQAALLRDYTLAMGLILLYAALLLVMNLLVDLAYGWLDPRVKLD